MVLDRYHGLGNDYLVLVDGPSPTPEDVRAICDRHIGVGGDGLLEPADRGPCDVGVRIHNPDGSVAEKSGNGLRIFARWLVDTDRVPTRDFTVWTGSCAVACTVRDDDVRVEMGTATTTPSEVPVLADGPLLDGALEGAPRPICAIGVGNPHCVMFVDEPLDDLPWAAWGEALEVHPAFPNRTNVQVARVISPTEVALRIWERGAGATLASGSSSCAVVAAAVATRRVPPGTVIARMQGGMVRVTVGPDLSVVLEGPVERIGRIAVDPGWVAARGIVSGET